MSASERETRLEAIMPDTTSLCEQIDTKSTELTKMLLDRLHSGEDDDDDKGFDVDGRIESETFVLQQVGWFVHLLRKQYCWYVHSFRTKYK